MTTDLEVRGALTERVLVCGDRNWRDRKSIERELSRLDPKWTLVVHGACRGADQMAEEVCRTLGIRTEAHPADWSQGPSAGPRRNQEMLNSGVDRVLAFHSNIAGSKGTADMVRRARAAGIPVTVFDR
jgi:ABC-type sugar transport system substrate-binding protein